MTINKIKKDFCMELNPSFHGLLSLHPLGHLVGSLLIALSPNLPTLLSKTHSKVGLSEVNVIAFLLLL